MIEIDGASGEGGGQMIRTSLTLSAITGKPVRIFNIRAKRPNPGLAMQHVTCAKAVRSICRGTLVGAEEGSSELSYHPGGIVGGRYDFNIGTAGSVTLVAATIIPLLLRASKKSRITITGGTHVMKSPGYDYFEHLFIPAIRRFGAKVESRMLNAGYYPKGGGNIEMDIEPSDLRGCASWGGEEQERVMISLANLPESIAIREKKIFVQEDITWVTIRQERSLSQGNSVTAWKGLRGAYSLGEKGKRAEVVAKEALDGMRAEKGDLDMHLADQVLIYAALAEGETSFETGSISGHFNTNAALIQRFVDRKITAENGKVRIT